MENLKKIMDTDIKRKHKFESMEEIYEFERKYKFTFSPVYEIFLLKYGSGYVKDNYFYKAIEKTPLTPKDGYNSTDYFYGSDIVDNFAIYYDELEEQLLPIADTGGGDFICLGTSGEYKDKIYYWSHEGGGILAENLFLIANTFEDFISSFEEHNQDIPIDDIELFLDDDLLND